MLISKKWLSEFVKLPDVSDRELAERLTLSTVEVEGVNSQADAWDRIVVGVIKTVSAHPNADRLRVCQVDAGLAEPVQIVCGGQNVREGMKVVVALPGSRVRWHGEGEPIVLEETKIRGEKSFGMICASVEIGLDPVAGEGDHDIRELVDVDAVPGTPLATALNRDDVVFEIDNKSLTNRPDLVSHYGLARELAALYRADLLDYAPPRLRGGKGYELAVQIEDKDACPRYMGVVIDGVEVGPSPDWMQERLAAVGIRAINNVVDVTNYVMVEGGQSLHAFDASQLEAGNDRSIEINVRRAKPGETLVTLDGVERKLDPTMLVIADARKPVVLAGVMGGENSGVTEATKTIFLESANFDATVVRKTSQALSLRSEASMRYEKSLDPMLADLVLRRAVELLQELHPRANIVSQVVDVFPREPEPRELAISPGWLAERLGVEMEDADVKDILTRLGFTVSGKKMWKVIVPSWRATKDITIPEDVAEEVARVWGYERIPAVLPAFPVVPPAQDPIRTHARIAREVLSRSGAAIEVYNYAFARPGMLHHLGLRLEDHVKLANPLSDERPYLVRSLVPNLLENVTKNQHFESALRLFEIDRVFHGEAAGDDNGNGSPLPSQPYMLALAVSARGNETPLRDASDLVRHVLGEMHYACAFVAYGGEPWAHPTRSAQVMVNEKVIGVVCEVASDVAAAVGIDRRVAVAELNLSLLVEQLPHPHGYVPIPEFPDVKRDIAFVVDERVEYQTIEHALRRASALLTSVELFDSYRGKGVPEGKKSLAVHLQFLAPDRTLSSEEVEGEMEKIRNVITKTVGGILRT